MSVPAECKCSPLSCRSLRNIFWFSLPLMGDLSYMSSLKHTYCTVSDCTGHRLPWRESLVLVMLILYHTCIFPFFLLLLSQYSHSPNSMCVCFPKHLVFVLTNLARVRLVRSGPEPYSPVSVWDPLATFFEDTHYDSSNLMCVCLPKHLAFVLPNLCDPEPYGPVSVLYRTPWPPFLRTVTCLLAGRPIYAKLLYCSTVRCFEFLCEKVLRYSTSYWTLSHSSDICRIFTIW